MTRGNVLRKREVCSSIGRDAESVRIARGVVTGVDDGRTRREGVTTVILIMLSCFDGSSDRSVRRHGVALRQQGRIIRDRIRSVSVERRRGSEGTLRVPLHWRGRIIGNRLAWGVGRVLLLRELGIGRGRRVLRLHVLMRRSGIRLIVILLLRRRLSNERVSLRSRIDRWETVEGRRRLSDRCESGSSRS